MADYDDYANANDADETTLASFFYPVALVVISITSFWVQSVVTEER